MNLSVLGGRELLALCHAALMRTIPHAGFRRAGMVFDPDVRRAEQLQRQLETQLELLDQIEQRMMVESRPLERAKLKQDAEQTRQFYARTSAEYRELQARVSTETAQPLQAVADQLERMGEKLTEIRADRTAGRFFVPFPRNEFFTGREAVLDALQQALRTGNATALTQAISGLGGIGKTQTAIEYAYRFGQEYTAVLWLRAESQADVLQSLVSLAGHLGLPEAQDSNTEVVVAAVLRWLAQN